MSDSTNPKDTTDPFQGEENLAPPTGYATVTERRFDGSFISGAGDDIFYFNDSFVYGVGDVEGDDFYVIGQYQIGNINLNDVTGDNRVYFDDNFVINYARISGQGLILGYDNGIGGYSELRVRDANTRYKFYLGNNDTVLTADQLVTDVGVTHAPVGTPTKTLTAGGVFELEDDTLITASTDFGVTLLGGIGLDVFTLGFSQDGTLNGRAGADYYNLTRFQESTSLNLRDTEGSNHFIVEGGVAIADVDDSGEAIILDLANGGEIRIAGGLTKYSFYLRDLDGMTLTGTEFLNAYKDGVGLTLSLSSALTVDDADANNTITGNAEEIDIFSVADTSLVNRVNFATNVANIGGTIYTLEHVDGYIGGSGADTVIVGVGTWAIAEAGDSLTITDDTIVDNSVTYTISNVETLSGSSGVEVFKLASVIADFTIDGSTGDDTLEFTTAGTYDLTTAGEVKVGSVTMNVANIEALTFSGMGDQEVKLGSNTAFKNIDAGDGTDSLEIASSDAKVLRISKNSMTRDDIDVTYENFESLTTTGTGNDAFALTEAGVILEISAAGTDNRLTLVEENYTFTESTDMLVGSSGTVISGLTGISLFVAASGSSTTLTLTEINVDTSRAFGSSTAFSTVVIAQEDISATLTSYTDVNNRLAFRLTDASGQSNFRTGALTLSGGDDALTLSTTATIAIDGGLGTDSLEIDSSNADFNIFKDKITAGMDIYSNFETLTVAGSTTDNNYELKEAGATLVISDAGGKDTLALADENYTYTHSTGMLAGDKSTLITGLDGIETISSLFGVDGNVSFAELDNGDTAFLGFDKAIFATTVTSATLQTNSDGRFVLTNGTDETTFFADALELSAGDDTLTLDTTGVTAVDRLSITGVNRAAVDRYEEVTLSDGWDGKDGYGLILGAPGTDSNKGAVNVYGVPSSRNTGEEAFPTTSLTASSTGNGQFGRQVELGDLDGDGNLDLIIVGSTAAEALTIIYGDGGRGPMNDDPNDMTGDPFDTAANKVTIASGSFRFNYFTSHYATANLIARNISVGDFNGDGFDDILLTTDAANYNGSNNGNFPGTSRFDKAERLDFISGEATKFTEAATKTIAALSDLHTGATDVGRYKEQVNLGDINNDGTDDFAFIDNSIFGTDIDKGIFVRIVYGNDKLGGNDTGDLTGNQDLRSNNDLTLGNLRILTGSNAAGHGAVNFKALGDINGDGVDDFAVAAGNNSLVYVVFGNTTTADIGKVGTATTSFSIADTFAADGYDGSAGFVIQDTHSSVGSRGNNVLDPIGMGITGIGDIDGDGENDFAFTESTRDTDVSSQVDSDAIYIVFGKEQIDDGNGNDISAFSGKYSVAELVSGGVATRIAHDLGDVDVLLSGLGDIDGDGYDDIGIRTSDGDFHVIYGGRHFQGFAGENFTADISLLSAGDDSLTLGEIMNPIALDGGEGTDTLIAANANLLLHRNFENATGTAGRDTITGTGENNRLAGGGGDDTFIISAGSDTITDFNDGDVLDFNAIGIDDIDDLAFTESNNTLTIAFDGNTTTLENVSTLIDNIKLESGTEFQDQAKAYFEGTGVSQLNILQLRSFGTAITGDDGVFSILDITNSQTYDINFTDDEWTSAPQGTAVMASNVINDADTVGVMSFIEGVRGGSGVENIRIDNARGYFIDGRDGDDSVYLSTSGTHRLTGAVDDFILASGSVAHTIRNVEKIVASSGNNNDTFDLSDLTIAESKTITIDGAGGNDTLILGKAGSYDVTAATDFSGVKASNFETLTLSGGADTITVGVNTTLKEINGGAGTADIFDIADGNNDSAYINLLGSSVTSGGATIAANSFRVGAKEIALSAFETYYGGDGTDILIIDSNTSAVTFDGKFGNDGVSITGAGTWTIAGTTADDFTLTTGSVEHTIISAGSLRTLDNNDNTYIVESGTLVTGINDEDGDDVLQFNTAGSFDLSVSTVIQTRQVQGIETLKLSDGNDTITLSANSDTFKTIDLGMGANAIVGASNVDLSAGTVDSIMIIGNVASVTGTVGDDTFKGDTGDNSFTGGAEADTFIASLGNDTIKDFGTGDDLLNFANVVTKIEDLTFARNSTNTNNIEISFASGGANHTTTLQNYSITGDVEAYFTGGAGMDKITVVNTRTIADADSSNTINGNDGIDAFQATGMNDTKLELINLNDNSADFAGSTVAGKTFISPSVHTFSLNSIEGYIGTDLDDAIYLSDTTANIVDGKGQDDTAATATNYKDDTVFVTGGGTYDISGTADDFTISNGTVSHRVRNVELIASLIGDTDETYRFASAIEGLDINANNGEDTLEFTLADTFNLSIPGEVNGMTIGGFKTLTLADGANIITLNANTSATFTGLLDFGDGANVLEFAEAVAHTIDISTGIYTDRGVARNFTGNIATVISNDGNDKLKGGDGDETFTGGGGNDTFTASLGDDLIKDFGTGTNKIDFVNSGFGIFLIDQVTFTTTGNDVEISFANGDANHTTTLQGYAATATATGTVSDYFKSGGGGEDLLVFANIRTAPAADAIGRSTVSGGAGFDVADFGERSANSLYTNLNSSPFSFGSVSVADRQAIDIDEFGFTDTYTLSSIEGVYSNANAVDHIRLSDSHNNFVDGGGAHDAVHVGAGSYNVAGTVAEFTISTDSLSHLIRNVEEIAGSSGAETFNLSDLELASTSTFTIDGAGGNDTLILGKAGTYTLSVADKINDMNVTEIETLTLSDENDTAIAGPNTKFTTINGGEGTDTISVANGNGMNSFFNLTNSSYTFGPETVAANSYREGDKTFAFDGFEVLNGNDRLDRLIIDSSSSGVTFDGKFNNDAVNIVGGGTWTFSGSSINNFTLTSSSGNAHTILSAGNVVATGTDAVTFIIASGTNPFAVGNANVSSNDVLQFNTSGTFDLTVATSLNGRQINNHFETLTLADGKDTITISSASTQFDTIDLGDGDNTITVAGTDAATINLTAGTYTISSASAELEGNIASITGGGGADTITGDAGDNTLNGGGEDDTLNGGAGNDTIDGDAGSDILNGNGGDDNLTGGADADTFIASLGNDTITDFGTGTDVLVFGSVVSKIEDLTFARNSTNNNNIEISFASVGMNHTTTLQNYSITGDVEAYFTTGAGMDLISFVNEVAEASNAFAGTGGVFDVADLSGASDDFAINLSTITVTLATGTETSNTHTVSGGNIVYDSSGASTYVLNSIEGVFSGTGGDHIRLSDTQNNFVDGGDGSDRVYLGEGPWNSNSTSTSWTISNGTITHRIQNVESVIASGSAADIFNMQNLSNGITIAAGGGNDTLNGGAGVDTFVGGAGADDMFGNAGDDNFWSDGDDETSRSIIVDNITYQNINDYIRGGAGNDEIWAGNGNDLIFAGDDDDTIVNGQKGRDIIFGGDGGDTLNGNDGSDTLYGEAGNDTLSGGFNGNDILDGGAGDDILTGGTNGTTGLNDTDTFVVSSGTDTINDFGASDIVDWGDITETDFMDFTFTPSGTSNVDLTISGFSVDDGTASTASELILKNQGSNATAAYWTSGAGDARFLFANEVGAAPAQENYFALSTAYELSFNGADRDIDFEAGDTLNFTNNGDSLNRDQLWQAIQQGDLDIVFDNGDINVAYGSADITISNSDYANQFGSDEILDTQTELDNFITPAKCRYCLIKKLANR